MECLLSVIIISHNQRSLLKRCIDSVLAQKTSFPFEVIVSDDRSNDGTYEMIQNDYQNKVIYTSCDSDKCSPIFTLERAAYNRLNGLKYASGKYLIHIDGDDYYCGNESFQVMIDTLEANPDCNLCFQNMRWLVNDSDLVNSSYFLDNKLFENNSIISAGDFISSFSYIHNSASCMRRIDKELEISFTTKTYDDKDITFQYIRDGKVALVNCAEFVYCQHSNGICKNVDKNDWRLLECSEFSSINLLLPSLRYVMIQTHFGKLFSLVKDAVKCKKVSDLIIQYYSESDVFVFRCFDNKFIFSRWLRLLLSILFMFYMKRFTSLDLSLCKMVYKIVF